MRMALWKNWQKSTRLSAVSYQAVWEERRIFSPPKPLQADQLQSLLADIFFLVIKRITAPAISSPPTT